MAGYVSRPASVPAAGIRGVGEPPLTYDHITPASRGGLTTFDNICLACRTCNEFKTNTIRAVGPLTQESAPLFHP
jgi:5-methylcytosine-specific restriction endonuclease McrA